MPEQQPRRKPLRDKIVPLHKKEKKENAKHKKRGCRGKRPQDPNAKAPTTARLVGVGMATGEGEFECSLPQYNLGEFFGKTQEPLRPVQRKPRHTAVYPVNEEYLDDALRKETTFFQHVWCELMDYVKSHGVTIGLERVREFYMNSHQKHKTALVIHHMIKKEQTDRLSFFLGVATKRYFQELKEKEEEEKEQQGSEASEENGDKAEDE